jgi:hypothetical protein
MENAKAYMPEISGGNQQELSVNPSHTTSRSDISTYEQRKLKDVSTTEI